MPKIECCNRHQVAEEYRIKTKAAKIYGYGEEFINVIQCSHCKKRTILYTRYDLEGNEAIEPILLRGKKLYKFEKEIIFKELRYKSVPVDKRMYLNYNKYGKEDKCYSNLSTMKMGLIDPDEGLDFFAA